jgi:1-acyl-sn-glycerol-3-phosphate acyltransferase
LTTTLRFYWRTFAVLLNTFVCWLCFEVAMLWVGKRNRSRAVNCWVPRWARNNLWIFHIEVLPCGASYDNDTIIPGHDSSGRGRIFIANHRSGLDIPLLLSLIEAHCISRHDLANWPIIGRGARRIGTLFVDRASRRSGAAVLKEVAHAVENGEGVAMFPEGTSFAGDEVRKFHTGAFNAARRANAQLMPMGIAYSDEAAYFVHEAFLAHAKRMASLKSMRVAVEFGEPIEFGDSSTPEVIKLAHERVQELVNRARARLGAN